LNVPAPVRLAVSPAPRTAPELADHRTIAPACGVAEVAPFEESTEMTLSPWTVEGETEAVVPVPPAVAAVPVDVTWFTPVYESDPPTAPHGPAGRVTVMVPVPRAGATRP
jgi:hypothetical protein